ncbi:hypothetical protein Tco_0993538 [Tanacetum coccineum]
MVGSFAKTTKPTYLICCVADKEGKFKENQGFRVDTDQVHQNGDLKNKSVWIHPPGLQDNYLKEQTLYKLKVKIYSINDPTPVLTRNQLRTDGEICIYALSMSTTEPSNVKEAMTDPRWIDSMQEELLQFKWLDVWELVLLEMVM